MKIGIDISSVIYGTGVSHYTRNLVKNLLLVDKENEYVLFGGSLRRKKELDSFLLSLKGEFQSKIVHFPPTLADFVWNNLKIFPIENMLGKIDVFHSSDWTQPKTSAFKVTTIHDLVPVKFPRLVHPRIYKVHKRRLEIAKSEVDRIIVPSEATREDLIKLKFKSEKIRVIPEAASFTPAKPTEVEAVKKKYKIDSKYILIVGVSQIKNTLKAIEAFELVRPGKNLKLVVVGRPINIKTKEGRGIRFVGHIPDEELEALFTGAEALLFPSLYEGFGIPILDAYSCGIPVVTSNTSSLPEVAGEGAILVDPKNVDSIAEGIEKVLSMRKTLIKKGEKQLSKFSWEKTARKTLDVYNESLI